MQVAPQWNWEYKKVINIATPKGLNILQRYFSFYSTLSGLWMVVFYFTTGFTDGYSYLSAFGGFLWNNNLIFFESRFWLFHQTLISCHSKCLRVLSRKFLNKTKLNKSPVKNPFSCLFLLCIQYRNNCNIYNFTNGRTEL